MSRTALALILFSAASFSNAQFRRPVSEDTADVFRGLSIASFAGTLQDSVLSLATDASGNVYAAGTTFSANFPVKNAEQSSFGEAAILRTTNLGSTWTRLTNPPGAVSVVVPDPVSPQIIFATGPTGIYRTIDGGQNWQTVYPIAAQPIDAPINLVIDPGNHLHLAAMIPPSTLVRSFDGGATWTPGPAGCGLPDCVGTLLADPAGSGTLVAVEGYQGTSISRDWGTTFSLIGPPLSEQLPTAAAFDPSHAGWIYLAEQITTGTGLYLSTDYGSTWTAKAVPSGPLSMIQQLAVNPNQPSMLVASAGNGIYKSIDGAASWTYDAPAPAGPYVPATKPLTFAIAPQACSAPGGVFAESGAASFSPDYGVTWTTPQLTQVNSIASGPGCAFYVTRAITSDVFVAKIAADGGVLWATYLGGSDQDVPVVLKVDASGDVYVAGNTSSPDFPVTAMHIGPQGENSAFVAKFSTSGALLYSATVGGEATNTATGLAIDQSGNAYLIGSTQSKQFPVTTNALGSQPPGFLAKLSSSGALTYATYVSQPGAILVDANEEPILGTAPNDSEIVMKLDASASRVLQTATLPAVISRNGQAITGLAFDSQNNLVVAGQTGLETFPASWPILSSGSQFCNYGAYTFPSPFAFVTTLGAANWQPLSGAMIETCEMVSGGVAVDSAGAIVLAVASGLGLPMRGALVGGPACTTNSGGILKLSADESTVEFGSYVNHCGVPAVAIANDGSIYTGADPASVLRVKPAPAISLNQISNAFSGDTAAVAAGGLYTLALSGFAPAATNLGFAPQGGLPDQLNGVVVKFDGVAAPVMATAAGQITVAAPSAFRDSKFTSIEVWFNGAASNPVWMPISKSLPGLFINVRNQDGSLNSATNPAVVGSTVTLFATGLGATNPPAAPGSIAASTGVIPITPLFSTWSQYPAEPLAITSIPGFVSAMFEVPVAVPAFAAAVNGITDATVQLIYELQAASVSFPASNSVSVYVAR